MLPANRRRPEGATDVAEALNKWFPAGSLQRSPEVFRAAAAEPLDVGQLGSPLYKTNAVSSTSNCSTVNGHAGGIAVYRHRLSEANSYINVSHAAMSSSQMVGSHFWTTPCSARLLFAVRHPPGPIHDTLEDLPCCLWSAQQAGATGHSLSSAHAQALHRRIQPLLIFFIDACNFLEDEATGAVDSRWEMYLAVQLQGEHHIIVRRRDGNPHSVAYWHDFQPL